MGNLKSVLLFLYLLYLHHTPTSNHPHSVPPLLYQNPNKSAQSLILFLLADTKPPPDHHHRHQIATRSRSPPSQPNHDRRHRRNQITTSSGLSPSLPLRCNQTTTRSSPPLAKRHQITTTTIATKSRPPPPLALYIDSITSISDFLGLCLFTVVWWEVHGRPVVFHGGIVGGSQRSFGGATSTASN